MIDTATPEAVGMSSQRLERVSTWLDEQIRSERLAGASALIARHGKVAYRRAVGYADVDAGKAFDDDTIARIFSMTKPITTVAAMMLYERGSFQLDDPVAKYIPSFHDTQVWTGSGGVTSTATQSSPMLVKHLMTHTSGLTYGFMQTNVVDEQYREQEIEFPGASQTLEELVDRAASIPLICQPGSQWNYSISTDVLGRLVEVWSGQSLAEFFQENIFNPLGMCDTGFHVDDSKHARFAALYAPSNGASMANVGRAETSYEDRPGGYKLQESSTKSRYLNPAKLYSGGGGLTGTIEDYARFCQMLLNRGELDGVRVLGRTTVEHMRVNHLPDGKDMAAMGQPVWSETSYDGIGFGLGFAVVLDPPKAQIITSVGEHHWGGAASTFFWLDPIEDLYVVFFTQLIPSSTYPIRRELRSRVYQAIIS